MVIDPISASLTAITGLAGLFGSSSAADAQYEAEAKAIQAQNDEIARQYNESLMDIALENYGKFTERTGELIDYEIAVDNETSAAMRAFAENELAVQAKLDEFKKAEETLYVETRAKQGANEGGTTNARNINVMRAGGRSAGLLASQRKDLVADQYGANQELAREVNERIQREHDKVYTTVSYNTLMPEEPTFLDAPAAPSVWNDIAGLAGIATSAYTTGISTAAPNTFKDTLTTTTQSTATGVVDIGDTYKSLVK